MDHHAPPDPTAAGPGVVVVLAGGDPPDPRLVLPAAGLVVAADGGAAHAEVLGLTVDVLVGDLDSIAPHVLDALTDRGTLVERHHPDKDATDLELALAVAVDLAARRIVVVGGGGGRLDHALAGIGALASVAAPGRAVEAWMGPAQVAFVVDRVEVAARAGEVLSLVPVGGAVHGITTEGLRWPLVDAHIDAGSTLGVSNEVVAPPARVAVARGVLAVIRPHGLAPELDPPGPVPERP